MQNDGILAQFIYNSKNAFVSCFFFWGKKGKKLRHTCLNEILVSKFADAYIPKSLGNCIVSGAEIRVWRPN